MISQINTSYMASVKMFSIKPLKPLAPVFLAIAFFAIILRAFSVKCSFTWSARLKFQTNWIRAHTNTHKRRCLLHSCWLISCTVYQEHVLVLWEPASQTIFSLSYIYSKSKSKLAYTACCKQHIEETSGEIPNDQSCSSC